MAGTSSQFSMPFTNFYTTSTLNRLSWLRTSSKFLTQSLSHPSVKFLPFYNLSVLVSKTSDGNKLEYLSWVNVRELFDDGASGEKSIEEKLWEGVDGKDFEGMLKGDEALVRENNKPLIVFLGIEEGEEILPETKELEHQFPNGIPYFAISLSAPSPTSSVAFVEKLEAFKDRILQTDGREFMEPRIGVQNLLDWKESGIIAMGRSLIDWNDRNQVIFCL
jgi:NAD+ diphosphatase